MPQLHLSRHAAKRANQRGLPHHLIEALLAHADVEVPVGDGCSCLSCSREALRAAEMTGKIAERLKGLQVIVPSDGRPIITVFRDYGAGRGRRYRQRPR